MSADTMGQAALAKMRKVADGNGMAPEDIEFNGSDETVLDITAEMTLTLEMKREATRYPGKFRGNPKKSKTPMLAVGAANQFIPAAEKIKEDLTQQGTWITSIVNQLKAEPGEGWGLEDADITMDDQAQVLYFTENCTECFGRGNMACRNCNTSGFMACQHCRATGQELCYMCNGTGQNPQGNGYCQTCNGSTMAQCRQCQGRKQVTCTTCQGRGNITCPTCNGNGQFTTEETLTPYASSQFAITGGSSLPSGFRRAISRGGMASLTRGHADIKMLDADAENPQHIFIPYTARVPYAETRLRIAKKPVRITVLGKHNVLLDVPAFLDGVLEPTVAELEKAPGAPGALARALKLRILREALDVLQQPKPSPTHLRKFYPFGVSLPMLDRAIKLMRLLARASTKKMRLLGGAGVLAALALLDWVIIGLRPALLANTPAIAAIGFDIVSSLAGAAAMYVALEKISAIALQRLLGRSARATHRTGGPLAWGLSAGAALLYWALLFALHPLPNWL